MDNGIRDTVAGQWHAYLGGITTLALAGDAPPPAGSSPGEAVLRGAEAWARQGPWASGLFAREPTRVMVITGFGGSDGDLSRAIAVRLAAGFLHGQRGVPLPLRITMRGRQDGEGARELLSRHLGQAGLTIADWRRLNVPTLVTIDGLDDLLPAGRPLPAREELGLVSSLCSHELSQSRIVLVTARQPDETRLWRLVTDRLDEGAGLITVLDSTSGRSGSGARNTPSTRAAGRETACAVTRASTLSNSRALRSRLRIVGLGRLAPGARRDRDRHGIKI